MSDCFKEVLNSLISLRASAYLPCKCSTETDGVLFAYRHLLGQNEEKAIACIHYKEFTAQLPTLIAVLITHGQQKYAQNILWQTTSYRIKFGAT